MRDGLLDRGDVEQAFRALGEAARASGKVVELAVYGGTALILTLPARPATKDVDAVFESDGEWLRGVALDLAEQWGWPPDWLNDGVKGWLSNRDDDPGAKHLFRTYPSEEEPGLRVFVASPAYLFAMKCLAMRIGGVEVTQDRSDIEMLGRCLGIETAEAAFLAVAKFDPASRLPPRTMFGIQELFGEFDDDAAATEPD